MAGVDDFLSELADNAQLNAALSGGFDFEIEAGPLAGVKVVVESSVRTPSGYSATVSLDGEVGVIGGGVTFSVENLRGSFYITVESAEINAGKDVVIFGSEAELRGGLIVGLDGTVEAYGGGEIDLGDSVKFAIKVVTGVDVSVSDGDGREVYAAVIVSLKIGSISNEYELRSALEFSDQQISDEKASFLSYNLSSFKPASSGVSEGVFSTILQQGETEIDSILSGIFDDVVAQGGVPDSELQDFVLKSIVSRVETAMLSASPAEISAMVNGTTDLWDEIGGDVSASATSVTGGGCFLAGTPILMANGGTKPIEDVSVGDFVVAFEESNEPSSLKIASKRVSRIFSTQTTDVILFDGLGATAGHVFLTQNGFKTLGKAIEENERLISTSGQQVEIEDAIRLNRKLDVFNIEVEGFHTFFAGGFAVHNKSLLFEFKENNNFVSVFADGENLIVVEKVGEATTIEVASSSSFDAVYADVIDYLVNEMGRTEFEYFGAIASDPQAINDFLHSDPAVITAIVELHKRNKQFVSGVEFAGEVGGVFGSTLGKHLAGTNVFAGVLASTALGTITENVFEMVANGGVSNTLNLGQVNNVVTGGDYSQTDAGQELQQNFQSAAIGAVSSYLTAELIDALGISGFGGQLASTVGNTAINQVLSNIAHNATLGAGEQAINVFDGFGQPVQMFGNAVGSFLGSQLANKILSAETTAGQLGGSIGGAVGSIVATKLIGSAVSNAIGSTLGGILVPGIGALIGTLLGTLIGDLFGKTPRSGADLEYDPETGEFVVGHSWKRGKGSRETAEAMAGQVGETLNGVLGLVGGVLMNPEEVTPGHYGTYKSRLRWVSEYKKPAVYFKEAGDVIAFGTMVALEDMKILGGDIYMKRALNQSLENQKQGPQISIGGEMTAFRPADYDANALNDPEIEILLGDLSIARDYAAYLENAAVINALIAAQPDSAFAAGWIITLQRAYELGLHRRHESDWYGGWEFFLEENGALSGTVDLSLDPISGERLITFTDQSGVSRTLGDTVDSAGKDDIQGTAGADVIVVGGAILDHSASSAGLTVNGAALTADDHEIDGVAAIHGGVGNDTIWGGDRGNDLFGDAGDDRLYGGKTADWLFGGTGNDTLDANVSDDGNFLSGGAGNDSLIGRDGSDWLDGGAGVDTLDGGDGNDILEGGAGDDIVRGGRGDDIYRFDAGDGADAISDEGFAQAAPERPVMTVQVDIRFGPQSFSRIEALTLGYLGFNWDPRSTSYLQGGVSSVAATARGKAQGGDDTLVLGQGVSLSNIRLRRDADGAGVADDLLVEVLDTQGALTGDVVRLEDWFDPFNRVEWLEFADGQRFRIGDFSSFTIGTAGDDIIFGTDGNDFVHGGAGNDVMHLLRGDDVGNGGLGDDFITGDSGSDIVIGGNDNDIVLGGSGDDAVSGDLGDDLVRGDSGNDILTGGLGADTVVGGSGDDVFKYSRGDGRDTIIDAYSAAGWETVFNGAAGWVAGVTFVDVDHDNDPTTGLVSQVHYNGEVIFDGVRWTGAYSFNTTSNILRRHAGDAYGDAGRDTIEFGIGIEIADLVFQTVGGELVIGVNSAFSDNSSFDGLSDRVTLQGWNAGIRGIETFSFFNAGLVDLDGFAQLTGGTDGDDVIAGGGGADWLTGGAGDDQLDGAGGADLLVGHGGEDSLKGDAGDDTLLGGSGDDTLDGGAGADVLIGGDGVDIASYASAGAGVSVTLKNSAVVDANPITDVFSSIEGLEGSAFNDTLIGDDGDNEIIGGAGADRLEGGAGNDLYTIRAGDGDDVILDRGVDASGLFEEIAVSAEGAVGAGFAESFSLVNTTHLGGGSYQYTYQWTLTHSASGDTAYSQQLSYFSPQSSAPQFFNGNYWLNGFAATGRGREVSRTVGAVAYFDGGADDALLWETGESLSELDFTIDGNDLIVQGGANTLRIEGFQLAESRIEELSLSDGLAANLGGVVFNGAGTANEDFLVGDATANALNGGAGDDVISGGAGADTLAGDAGDDVLEGGVGADSLDGGEGLDTARYLGSSAGVTVNLVTGAGLGGEAEGDTLSSIEVVQGSQHNDNIIGDAADNRLFGHDGADVMDGAGGDDVLDGGLGADSLAGGAGDDNLDGGAGADTLRGGDGVDRLLGGDGNDQLFGDAGVDHLAGEAGDDVLEGGADNDVLDGGSGADILRGGAGDDILIGGAGNDTLEGGLGDDVYQFDASSGDDLIVDSDGVNQIIFAGAGREDLRFDRSGDDLVVKAIGTAGSLTLSNYYAAGGTAAHTIAAGDHILYLGQASAFFDLFASLPAAASAHDAAITGALDRYWHLFGNARPEGADIALTTDEDNAVAGAVAATDHDQNITGFSMAGAPLYGSVALDAATGAFTYTPDADFYGDDVFFVNIEDSGGNIVDVMVSIAVTPVNDAPAEVLFSGGADIAENAVEIDLGALAVVDVDGVPNEHTLSVDDARFEIVDNVLRLRSGVAIDFETEPSVTVAVTATDSAGASNAPSLITFNIVDVNEGPSLGAASLAVNEDASAGAAVGTMAASDPDSGAFGDLRYYFRSSAGAAISVSEDGLFAVDALTGVITVVGGGLDYEAEQSYALTGLVRDNGGAAGYLEETAAIDIAVGNVNEAPTAVSLSNAAVDENADGAIVGVLSATDADGPAGGAFSQHAFSVDDARFYVDGANNLRLKAGETLNFETEPTVSVNVTATDLNGAGLSLAQSFTISVNDLVDIVNGTAGADSLAGEQGVDHIFGYGGDDILTGGGGDDQLDGDAGADRLEGGAGNDSLSGGAGSDTLLGGGENDTLAGGDGEDMLDGGAGVDVINGGANNDTLYGREGADTLQGGDGNDLLIGGAGADALDGGLGEDTASYEDAASGVGIDLANGANNTGDAAGDTFTSIEMFRGSDHADTFTGDAGGNVFHGLGGNDTIIGDDGNDVLYGGAGDDFIDAGDGADMLDGGAGADTLIGGAHQDLYMIDRASGADVIRNYDPMNADDTISYADDIAYTDLWFERAGDDLVVSVIGTDTVTTIEGWYAGAGAGNMYDISLFLVDNRETISVDAEQLVTVMAQYLVDESVAKPQTQAEMQAALSVIGGAVDALWGFSTPPTIDAISDAAINEDGSVSFTARIYDDKVAAELLTVGAASSDPAIVAAADVAIGASDPDGYRQVTVTPKEDASGVVTVTLQATDGGSGVAEEAFTLTVSAVADMPTLAVFSASGNAGAAIALNIVASQTDNDLSETLTVEIAGVPATAVLSAGGDQGGGVWRLTPADLAGLTLTPAAGDATDLSLSVTAISSEGGTSEQVTMPLAVSVNGAPSDIAFSGTVDENAANGAIVGDASHTDPDIGGAHVYSLVNDAGGRFAIDGATGAVSVLNGALLDHEASSAHAIRIRVVDQGGLAREEDFTVNVANVNEAPTDLWPDRTLSFDEGAPFVAWFGVSDPDIGDTATVSLLDDAGGRYQINPDANGMLMQGSVATDYETATSHNILMRVTDGSGAFYDEWFTINVNDVNEAPTDIFVQSAPNPIYNADFESANTTLDTASSLGDYSLTTDGWELSGVAGTWAPNASVIYNQALPTAGSRVLFINGGGTASRLTTETIEAGTDYTLSAWFGRRTAYAALGGTMEIYAGDPSNVVAAQSITDPGAGIWSEQSISVSQSALAPYIGQRLGVRFVGSGQQLNIDDVTLTVERGGVEVSSGPAVLENPSFGAVVADFGHDDPEGGTMAYELVDDAGGRFAINATTGVVTVTSFGDNPGAIDYETATSHGITVKVTDPGGLSRTENFTVNVANLNEAPTITDIAPTSHTTEPSAYVIQMPEDKAYRDWDVAYLSSSDPEGSAQSYLFRHGDGTHSTISEDGRFKIINTRIEVNHTHLNYETTPNSLTYAIVARDAGGLYSSPQNLTINVTDVNERPTVSGATFNRAENWNPTVSIGTVSFSDPDLSTTANGQVSMSIIGGNTGNKFRINNDGTLWLNSALDYENASQRNFSLTVRARDNNGSGLYHDAVVNVNVTNILEAPVITRVRSFRDVNNYSGYDRTWADIDAYDPDGSVVSYHAHSSSDFSISLVRTNGSGNIWLDRTWLAWGYATIRITDQQGQSVYRSVYLRYETSGPGGGGPLYPVVLDLDGDGVELTEPGVSGVQFDIDADGVMEETGWVGADDGLLAIDRNGNGIIDDGLEISYVDDLEGATTDLEGLVAFDTNGNRMIDAGDADWASFRVWRDVNQNGVSEAGELQTLDQAGIQAISLTRTLTGDPWEPHKNHVSATTEFIWSDGSIGAAADVAFYTYELPGGDLAPPVVLDLNGDGLDITPIYGTPVTFDMNGDGVRDRTAWVGPEDGLVVLDRNGDGVINDVAEISFIDDLEGATTDLEGLHAFDSDGDNLLDAGDEMFDAFQVWRDANQNGVSEAGELQTLSEAGILWIDLGITKTGTEADGVSDFVVTGISNFVTTAGDIRLVGDAAFRFIEQEAPETADAAADPSTAAPSAAPDEASSDSAGREAAGVGNTVEPLFNSMLRDMAFGDREISLDDRFMNRMAPLAQSAAGAAVSDSEARSNAEYAQFLEAMARFGADHGDALGAARASHWEERGVILAASY